MSNVELATAYLALVPSMQGAQGKIAEALIPASTEGDKAGRNAGGKFVSGFSGMATAAAVGGAAIGAAAVGATKALFGVGETFDSMSDTIRVATGATGVQLDSLVESSKNVAKTVPTDFQTAGTVVSDISRRLGLSGKTLETVASQYIQAGNILGQTVDIDKTTAAFNAFGIKGTEVQGSMDALFRVSQATGVGMNDLAAQVQANAAPLKNLGFNFNETASLAGVLDKAGLNSSAVMASMSKGLVTLAKSGEEPQAAFKRVTGEIQTFVGQGNTAAALDLASKVFGTRGAAQFVGAIQSGKVNLKDLASIATNGKDTILGLGKETADAAESWQLLKNKALVALEPIGAKVFNLAGSGLAFLANNIDGVIAKVTSIGSRIGPAMAGIKAAFKGDFTADLTKAFGLTEDSPIVGMFFTIRDAVISVFGSITSAIGPLIPQIVALWSSFSPLQIIFQAIQPLLPTLLAVFQQLASVIGTTLQSALTTIVPIFQQLSTLISQSLGTILAAVLPGVIQMVTLLGGALSSLLPVLLPIITTVAQLVAQLVGALAPIITQLVTAIMPPIVDIFGNVVAAIAPLVQMIGSILIPIIQALLPVVTTVFGAVANVIKSVMQIVQGIIQVVTGIISGNWSQVWTGIQNIFGGIWNTIVSLVSGAINIVGSVISGGLNLVFSVVGSVLGSIGRFFADTWNNIVNGVSGFIGDVVKFFTDLPGKILNAVAGFGSLLLDVGRNLVQGLIDGVGGMINSAVDAVKNVGGAMLDGVKGFLGIKSPSVVFQNQVGRMIGLGVIAGVDSTRDQVADSARRLVTVPDVPASSLTTFNPLTAAGAAGVGGGPSFINYGPLYGDPQHIADEITTQWRRGATLNQLRQIASVPVS